MRLTSSPRVCKARAGCSHAAAASRCSSASATRHRSAPTLSSALQKRPMVARIHASLPLLAPLLAAFCGCEGARPPASVAPPSPPLSPPSSSLAPMPQASAGAEGSPLKFIEDDYAGALAQARARGLPVFIDAWAPWCHTCLSMREYVLSDALLAPFASHFVFLSLDTEREGNAGVVDKLGVHVLPTMFVVDPNGERVVFAWPGSMTAVELGELLREASSTATPSRWLDPDRLADVRVTA